MASVNLKTIMLNLTIIEEGGGKFLPVILSDNQLQLTSSPFVASSLVKIGEFFLSLIENASPTSRQVKFLAHSYQVIKGFKHTKIVSETLKKHFPDHDRKKLKKCYHTPGDQKKIECFFEETLMWHSLVAEENIRAETHFKALFPEEKGFVLSRLLQIEGSSRKGLRNRIKKLSVAKLERSKEIVDQLKSEEDLSNPETKGDSELFSKLKTLFFPKKVRFSKGKPMVFYFSPSPATETAGKFPGSDESGKEFL